MGKTKRGFLIRLATVALVSTIGACADVDEPCKCKPPYHLYQPEKAKVGIQPGSREDFDANVGYRVFFDYDRHSLRADAQQQLDLQAVWLKKYPTTKFVIEGHADERGTRDYNIALGERRANTVRDYLVAAGIDRSRILRTVSYGKERPVATGSNEAAWSQNRRVWVVIE